jgi:hypothetical protein
MARLAVFDMLVQYNACKDWSTALLKAMPPRKGFVLKTSGGNDHSDNAAFEAAHGAIDESQEASSGGSDADNSDALGDSDKESEDED